MALDLQFLRKNENRAALESLLVEVRPLSGSRLPRPGGHQLHGSHDHDVHKVLATAHALPVRVAREVSVGPICNANREFMYVLNMWTFLFHGAVGGCFMARICCRPRLRTRCRAVRVCDCEDSARSINRSQVGKKTTGYG